MHLGGRCWLGRTTKAFLRCWKYSMSWSNWQLLNCNCENVLSYLSMTCVFFCMSSYINTEIYLKHLCNNVQNIYRQPTESMIERSNNGILARQMCQPCSHTFYLHFYRAENNKDNQSLF